jgi:hypothetical protein
MRYAFTSNSDSAYRGMGTLDRVRMHCNQRTVGLM